MFPNNNGMDNTQDWGRQTRTAPGAPLLVSQVFPTAPKFYQVTTKFPRMTTKGSEISLRSYVLPNGHRSHVNGRGRGLCSIRYVIVTRVDRYANVIGLTKLPARWCDNSFSVSQPTNESNILGTQDPMGTSVRATSMSIHEHYEQVATARWSASAYVHYRVRAVSLNTASVLRWSTLPVAR